MRYEVFEDQAVAGQWRVEAFGQSGECYITVFAGDDAEVRARAYANWIESRVEATPLMSGR